jgi:hypothetical protein
LDALTAENAAKLTKTAAAMQIYPLNIFQRINKGGLT